jgi:hypothetical protein
MTFDALLPGAGRSTTARAQGKHQLKNCRTSGEELQGGGPRHRTGQPRFSRARGLAGAALGQTVGKLIVPRAAGRIESLVGQAKPFALVTEGLPAMTFQLTAGASPPPGYRLEKKLAGEVQASHVERAYEALTEEKCRPREDD